MRFFNVNNEIWNENDVREQAEYYYNNSDVLDEIDFSILENCIEFVGRADYIEELSIYIFNTYSEEYDLTTIYQDLLNEHGVVVSTEVKGFYYGTPNEEATKGFYGKLKAEFI